MGKLNNVIKQLSETDFNLLYKSLVKSNAEKSALLLEYMRKKSYADTEIMEILGVSSNAYYTLRSRLNQKIEEYLLEQMETPRADIIKKVAHVYDVVFTKRRAISIATLQKLEKELIDYDLSSELTIVYKILKRLHIHSPEHFTYSKLYNEHVAYMLSVDKAEDLLASYFKKFGSFALSGDPTEKMELRLLSGQMHDVAQLYKSHRLYVYQSYISVFHQLFILHENDVEKIFDPVEDTLRQVEHIFNTYTKDSTYFHLRVVMEYLNMLYYHQYNLFRKEADYAEDVMEHATVLLENMKLYAFTPFLFIVLIRKSIRAGTTQGLIKEKEKLFKNYQADPNDLPSYIFYKAYHIICHHYAGNHEDALVILNDTINDTSLKKYPLAMLELRALLALEHKLLKDEVQSANLANNIQRYIRSLGKENCMDAFLLIKALKVSSSDNKRNKQQKITLILKEITSSAPARIFSPIRLLELDRNLAAKLE